MKTCHSCKRYLSIDAFSKHSFRKDGLRDECKECVLIRLRSYTGKLQAIYNNQQGNSRKRNHPAPDYTCDAFCKWAEQHGYASLYIAWVTSGYKRNTSPSTDRLNDSLPYTLDNLQLVTWKQNDDKAHQDLISGKLVSNHTAIRQLSLSGEHIATFPSQHAAQRATGISQGNIGIVCRQNTSRETAGGFKWEYTSA